jgi:hypothetical protein
MKQTPNIAHMQSVSISKAIEKSVELNRFPWKIAVFLYTVSYGFMFGFLDAYFWDDWFYSNFTDAEAHQFWKDQLGFFPTNRFIEISLLHRNPVLFHLLTFVIFLLIPVVAFSIAKCFKMISQEERFYLAIILLVLPINSARVSMACFRLSYSLLIFLFAWLVLVHPRTSRYKYFATPLFLVSFLAQPLIPLFVLPCLHNVYLGYSKDNRQWKAKIFLQASFIAVAPIYLLTAWVFSPPVEERRDYFTPGLSGVVRALVILLAVSLVFVWSASRKHKDQEHWKTNVLFSLSFLFMAFGAVAYIASGRLVDISEWMLTFVPRASDWDSRHQLLLGLGISLFMSTFLMTIDKKRRTRVFVGFVTLCAVLNFSMMQGYYFDALKQKEFVSHLSKIEDIADWKLVVLADEANVYNARNRELRTYEWEQMIFKAGGNEEVVVITSTLPCATDQKQESAVFLLVESSRGRLASMVKGEVGLNLRVASVSVCP